VTEQQIDGEYKKLWSHRPNPGVIKWNSAEHANTGAHQKPRTTRYLALVSAGQSCNFGMLQNGTMKHSTEDSVLNSRLS